MNNNNIRTEMLDVIIESINDLVSSHIENERSNPLCGDAHFYMFESKRSVEDFSYLLDERHSSDLRAYVLKAKTQGVSDSLIIEALKKSVNIEVDGIYIPNNAVESWGLGEQEIQIEELNDLDLTDDERTYLARNIDAYWDKKSDCVYVSMSYENVWMTCSVLSLKRNLGKLVRSQAVQSA
jgi:hypothetical protein